MIKAIKKFLLFRKLSANKLEFEVIGRVLVVHVPTGNLPHKKAEEYCASVRDTLVPNKIDFGVNKILVVAKRG